MNNLIQFEIKKFFSRKKNLLVIALFILLSVLFISSNSKLDKNLTSSELTNINFKIESFENAINSLKSETERLPDNVELKQINEDYKATLVLLNEQKNTYLNNDRNKYLSLKIQLDQKDLNDIESGNVIGGEDPSYLKENIAINSILLEKNIKPINTSASMEGLNFIKLFLNNPISIVLVILIIILNADIVSSEYDSNTFKLLFTQPIRKSKIILSKVLSSIIITNVIFISLLTIIFVSLGFINGFGNPEYPINFLNNRVSEYIGVGKFVLYSSILFILLVNFICIFTNLISTLTKNTATSMSLSIVIIVSVYMISSKGLLNEISHLNPFTYIDIPNVLTGSLSNIYKNSNVNLKYGLIIFILSTLLLLVLTMFIFEKKSITRKLSFFNSKLGS